MERVVSPDRGGSDKGGGGHKSVYVHVVTGDGGGGGGGFLHGERAVMARSDTRR